MFQMNAAVGGAVQPLLRDRRAQHVARELFEAVATVRRDGDVGVEIEALEMRLAAARGGHPGRARHARQLQHPRPGPELRRGLLARLSAAPFCIRRGASVSGRSG
jgi:hypothetical protein